jgi:hypothetical protein
MNFLPVRGVFGGSASGCSLWVGTPGDAWTSGNMPCHHRKRLTSDGVSYVAVRAEGAGDFHGDVSFPLVSIGSRSSDLGRHYSGNHQFHRRTGWAVSEDLGQRLGLLLGDLDQWLAFTMATGVAHALPADAGRACSGSRQEVQIPVSSP